MILDIVLLLLLGDYAVASGIGMSQLLMTFGCCFICEAEHRLTVNFALLLFVHKLWFMLILTLAEVHSYRHWIRLGVQTTSSAPTRTAARSWSTSVSYTHLTLPTKRIV